MVSDWWRRLTSELAKKGPGPSDPVQSASADQAIGNPFEIPVVRCPTCAGEGVTLQSPPTGHHRPAECPFCEGRGLVRAQLVISLVDLPTGRVASRSIVPGVLTAQAGPWDQAVLDLAPVVRDLASALDVQSIYKPSSGKLFPWNPERPSLIYLRYAAEAEADLSDDWRFEYEGAAIARQAQHRPQLIFYSGVELQARPSADESFRHLVQMSGQLQLDLIVDVRVEHSQELVWGVRLDIPGDAVPDRFSNRFNNLHRALQETSVEAALDRLRTRSVSAPARWLETSPDGSRPSDLSWPELSTKLTSLALQGGEGAIGLHRRGEWFLSALERAVDPENDLESRLRPAAAMPEPTGALIPVVPCPKCAGDSTEHCYRCAAQGTLLDGLALTITDLDGRTKNVNWYPLPTTKTQDEQGARETVSGLPAGRTEILLDRFYSVGDQAKSFEVPPHRLRDHYRNRVLDLSLTDGKVSNPDTYPLVSGYLRRAARRRPGGRLIVLARPDPEPPTEALFRSVLGLGLTLGVRVRTAKKGRKPPAPAVSSWRVRALPGPDLGPNPRDVPFGSTFPSLAAAVADLEAGFDAQLSRALDVGKLEPLRVPQQAVPVRVDVEAIEASLDGLSDVFPDTEIWLCIDLNSWTGVIGEPYHRSASAATIQEVLAPLVAPDLLQPGPEDLRRLLDLLFDEKAGQGRLEAEIGGVQGRYRFGLALASLLKCLFRERFGMVPEQAELDEYAVEAYRDALGEPIEDGEAPPEPAVLSELLASIADPTRTAWRRMLLEEHLSAMLQILASLLRDRLETRAETSAIVDQAVEEGMLMARAVREGVEHREQ